MIGQIASNVIPSSSYLHWSQIPLSKVISRFWSTDSNVETFLDFRKKNVDHQLGLLVGLSFNTFSRG